MSPGLKMSHTWIFSNPYLSANCNFCAQIKNVLDFSILKKSASFSIKIPIDKFFIDLNFLTKNFILTYCEQTFEEWKLRKSVSLLQFKVIGFVICDSSCGCCWGISSAHNVFDLLTSSTIWGLRWQVIQKSALLPGRKRVVGKEEIFVDSFCSRKSTWQMQKSKTQIGRRDYLVSLSSYKI